MTMVRPTPPAGYKTCDKKPLNVYQVHSAQPSTMPYWEFETWEEMGTNVLYYRVLGSAGEVYWEYPTGIACGSALVPGGTGGDDTKKIKQVQSALNEYFDDHPHYPLVVDGSFGPKTCAAAYGYQQGYLSNDSVRLTEAFFTSLDLPAWYSTTKFEMSCTPWYVKDAYQPVAPPVITPQPTPQPPSAPVVNKAGFPLWMGVLATAIAFGAMVVVSKKKHSKKRRKR